MATYSMYELSGINRCKMRRERNIHLQSAGNENAGKRKRLVKEIIKSIREGSMTAQQATKVIDDFFEEDTDFATAKTRKIFAEEMKACLNRYFMSEKRALMGATPMKITVYPGMEVEVRPDAIYATSDVVEVICYEYSRPKITQNGSKKDMSANNSLRMYALLCYAKVVANSLRASLSANVVVKASIYYLRKSNDSEKKGVFDQDFFNNNGKNVVTLADNEPFASYPTGVDKTFIPQIKEFLQGEDKCYSEENCQFCEFNKLCSFKRPPIAIPAEKKVKPLKELRLTKSQADAIMFKKGIARINAGAGAGKTLTVAMRTVQLLKDDPNLRPEEIVLLTFTNTGAEEMRERISVYNKEYGNGCDISEMRIQTFNAFMDAIVHKEWERLGFTKEPRLIDDVERSAIIVDILKNVDIPGIDFRNFYMNTKDVQGALIVARKIFNIMKTYSLGDDPDDIAKIAQHLGLLGKFIPLASIEQMAFLYDAYTEKLNDECLIEYADQELLTFQMFYSDPDYFAKMGIKHVIVDEFQDSNQGQMDFIRMIIGTPCFESLMVVGDDSQAIFGFRDTSPKFIIDFYDLLGQKGTDFFLLENHRSTPEIIDFANKLNDLNKAKVEKNLIATRDHGKKPVARGFINREMEYDYIVESIQKKIKAGAKPEDIAFIASTKNELLKMASLLSEKEIPSVLLNPEPLKDNSRVMAAIDMIRFIENTSATECQMSWLNCLSRNTLLQMTDKDIEGIMVRSKAEVEALRKLPEKSKRQAVYAMLDNLDDEDEVYQSFVETLKTKPTFERLAKYCNDFLLYGAECAVRRQHDYPGVVLTTAHSSKGLEWPIVFNSISKYDSPEIRRKEVLLEEKRRLLFVSATRARDELHITGQYIAFNAADQPVFNMFLQESYEILGQGFNPDQDLQAAKAMKAAQKLNKKSIA